MYLWLKLMLGNDILVRLDSNKYEINLLNGESEEVELTSSVVANPLCNILCNYNFIDLSNNQTIDNYNFNIKTGVSIKKVYNITSDKKGIGQKVYKYEIECRAIKTVICDTNEETVNLDALILLNYNLNENEKTQKNNVQEKISYYIITLDNFLNEINKQNILIKKINEKFDEDYLNIKINNINYSLLSTVKTFNTIKEYWELHNYEGTSKIFNELDNNLNMIDKNLNELNNTVYYKMNNINYIVNKTKEITNDLNLMKLDVIKSKNKSKEIELNYLIENYNQIIDNQNRSNLSEVNEKLNKYLKIEGNLKNSLINVSDEENYTDFIFNDLVEINLNFINISKIKRLSFELKLWDEKSECCFFGVCENCCEESTCSENSENYPILLLHGHSFNKNAPIENSLNYVDSLKKEIESIGYIDVGLISSYNQERSYIWSKLRYPIITKGSYYLDYFEDKEGYLLIQSNSENIDSYAVRLKSIIDDLKEKSGKPKVNVIAHSMGGLVVRRYIQLFGEESIDKLIMIGTPNKGISGNTAEICPVFGEKKECNDMKEGSLFMRKLNSETPSPNIKILNIIGDGCDMGNGEYGDGIVSKNSAYLEGAINYYTLGSCGTLSYLHTDLIYPKKYPDVCEQIKSFLK